MTYIVYFQLVIFVAMHNLQGCHAELALSNLAIGSYLLSNGQNNRPSNERNLIMGLIRNYREWRRTRETVSELNRLSNRELQDLGISRSEIPYIARQAR